LTSSYQQTFQEPQLEKKPELNLDAFNFNSNMVYQKIEPKQNKDPFSFVDDLLKKK
jgi:hypothetical protein